MGRDPSTNLFMLLNDIMQRMMSCIHLGEKNVSKNINSACQIIESN